MLRTFRCGHPKPESYRYGCVICKREREKMYRRLRKGEETPGQKRARESWQAGHQIVMRLAEVTGSSIDFVLGDSRWQEISAPRQAAYVAMKRRGMSYPRIGTMFGRDHSTIIDGCKRAKARAAIDPDYAALIEGLAA